MTADQALTDIQAATGTMPSPHSFCIIPFIHYSTTTVGDFKLCCRSEKIGHVDETDIKDLWAGDRYGSIRNSLIEGKRIAECKACWQLEDTGIQSLRQSHNTERARKYANRVIDWIKHGTISPDIPIIELKLSNICNLRCRMCWPKDSTPWLKDWDLVKDLYSDGDQRHIQDIIDTYSLARNPILNRFESNSGFLESFLEHAAGIEELEFAGGEPLLDPLHFKIISRLPHPERVILKYNTNLTRLNFNKKESILDLWHRFKGVKLTISIDGSHDLNAWIRKNSDLDEIMSNIATVRQSLGKNLIELKITTCISAMNATGLSNIFDDVVKVIDAPWITTRLQYPNFMHANVLHPDDLQRGIEGLMACSTGDSINKHVYDRQLQNSIRWLQHCIDHNTFGENNMRYMEYNKRMPD